jgi:Spy/CpxP family protein refolding chaperone
MNKSTFLRIAGVLMIMATITMTALAVTQHDGKGKGRGMMNGDRIEKLASKLELTDAQKAQIKSIQENFQSQNAGTLNEVKTLRETMRQQMKDGNREGAQATRTQLQAKMETLKGAREQMATQIRNVLTADQQAKLDAMKAEHGDRCGGKRHGDRRKGTGANPGQNQMNGQGQGTLK